VSGVLHLQLERGRYAPGEVVNGLITVMLGQDSRTLSVSLDYCEATRDYQSASMSSGAAVLHQGPLQAGRSFPFALTVPPDAPPAFRSRHGTLYWQVDAKADRSGRDPHARLKIDVIPPDAGGVVLPVASLETAAVAPPPRPDQGAVAPGGAVAGAPPPVAPAVPAGWYADPSGQARLRYWAGSEWTERTSP